MEKETPPVHSRDLQDTDTSAAAPITIDSSSSEQRPRPHLCIDIPAAAPEDELRTPATQGGTSIITPPSTRRPGQQTGSSRPSRPPLRSPSFMLKQTVKSLLPAGSFKFSFGSAGTKTKVMSRTSSLPLDDALLPSSQPPPPIQQKQQPGAGAVHHHMCRSQSLPMNMNKMKKLNNNSKSFKRMDSLGGMYRVVPTTPRSAAPVVVVVPPDDIVVPSDDSTTDDGGEDIPEEEAVCRICMVELSEGSDTLIKLECSCKGELALAHRDCAVKWFSIKGSRTCEVCQQDVQNLPVTLLRLQSMQQQQRGNLMMNRGGDTSRYDRYRVWHGTPILVIISVLAYFCFLEELLVAHEGIAALAISLPFSCILGLFSSLTTTSMVARRYVWIYAAVQFLLVVFFTHLFYKYLHLQVVISIILATFAGFGVGMTGNSIVIEILRWRARQVGPPTQQARRHRSRARAPQQQQQQQQAPPASDSEQPSSQPSAANVGVGVGVGQHGAMAAAGDVENPAVPQA